MTNKEYIAAIAKLLDGEQDNLLLRRVWRILMAHSMKRNGGNADA